MTDKGKETPISSTEQFATKSLECRVGPDCALPEILRNRSLEELYLFQQAFANLLKIKKVSAGNRAEYAKAFPEQLLDSAMDEASGEVPNEQLDKISKLQEIIQDPSDFDMQVAFDALQEIYGYQGLTQDDLEKAVSHLEGIRVDGLLAPELLLAKKTLAEKHKNELESALEYVEMGDPASVMYELSKVMVTSTLNKVYFFASTGGRPGSVIFDDVDAKFNFFKPGSITNNFTEEFREDIRKREESAEEKTDDGGFVICFPEIPHDRFMLKTEEVVKYANGKEGKGDEGILYTLELLHANEETLEEQGHNKEVISLLRDRGVLTFFIGQGAERTLVGLVQEINQKKGELSVTSLDENPTATVPGTIHRRNINYSLNGKNSKSLQLPSSTEEKGLALPAKEYIKALISGDFEIQTNNTPLAKKSIDGQVVRTGNMGIGAIAALNALKILEKNAKEVLVPCNNSSVADFILGKYVKEVLEEQTVTAFSSADVRDLNGDLLSISEAFKLSPDDWSELIKLAEMGEAKVQKTYVYLILNDMLPKELVALAHALAGRIPMETARKKFGFSQPLIKALIEVHNADPEHLPELYYQYYGKDKKVYRGLVSETEKIINSPSEVKTKADEYVAEQTAQKKPSEQVQRVVIEHKGLPASKPDSEIDNSPTIVEGVRDTFDVYVDENGLGQEFDFDKTEDPNELRVEDINFDEDISVPTDEELELPPPIPSPDKITDEPEIKSKKAPTRSISLMDKFDNPLGDLPKQDDETYLPDSKIASSRSPDRLDANININRTGDDKDTDSTFDLDEFDDKDPIDFQFGIKHEDIENSMATVKRPAKATKADSHEQTENIEDTKNVPAIISDRNLHISPTQGTLNAKKLPNFVLEVTKQEEKVVSELSKFINKLKGVGFMESDAKYFFQAILEVMDEKPNLLTQDLSIATNETGYKTWFDEVGHKIFKTHHDLWNEKRELFYDEKTKKNSFPQTKDIIERGTKIVQENWDLFMIPNLRKRIRKSLDKHSGVRSGIIAEEKNLGLVEVTLSGQKDTEFITIRNGEAELESGSKELYKQAQAFAEEAKNSPVKIETDLPGGFNEILLDITALRIERINNKQKTPNTFAIRFTLDKEENKYHYEVIGEYRNTDGIDQESMS